MSRSTRSSITTGDWPPAQTQSVGGGRRPVPPPLEADPNHAGALQGLAHALRAAGPPRPRRSGPRAWRAARLTGFADQNVLATLADVYGDAGRAPEDGLRRDEGPRIGPGRHPRLGFDVRRRLEQLRERAGR